MKVWFAKAALLAVTIALIAIRAPHGQRSRSVAVIRSRKGLLEVVLLTLAWLGFFIPLIWILYPVFSFAEYPLHPVAFVLGIACSALGLWLFHRSHADLGRNWSITLQIRESHELVTHGVYRRVRHPMYSALLLLSLGQALFVPNWVAGPSYLVSMLLLFAFRVLPEERMMREQFGQDYDAYAARTKRLVPGFW